MIPHERAPVKHGKRKRRAAMALTDRCAALKCGGACPLFLHFFAGQPVSLRCRGLGEKNAFRLFPQGTNRHGCAQGAIWVYWPYTIL